MKVKIPPIKCQGIKTKLVEWIFETIAWDYNGVWIEPFCGSGVVGFNVRPDKAIFSDINPHIMHFYKKVYDKEIDPHITRSFLEQEGDLLQKRGIEYYYEVRSRFNNSFDPLDFLFLNRACFNGVIRFNSKGKFNVPSNNKVERFSKSYVTKIVNQVKYVYDLFSVSDYEFLTQDFPKTIERAKKGDFIYCDPPYLGRHVDYYNSWSDKYEQELFNSLENCNCKFILSSWDHNKYRSNPSVQLWALRNYSILKKDHYYFVGAKEDNRNLMVEALITNYDSTKLEKSELSYFQSAFLERRSSYIN